MYLFQPRGQGVRGRRAGCAPPARRVYALALTPADAPAARPRAARQPSRVPRASRASWFFGEAIIRLCNGGRKLEAESPPAEPWE